MVKLPFLKDKYGVQVQLKHFSNCVLICVIIISLTSQSETISAGNVFLIFKKFPSIFLTFLFAFHLLCELHNNLSIPDFFALSTLINFCTCF